MVLKISSTGPQVTGLQERLQQRGFDPGGVDGQFGPETETAVRSFQSSVGLQSDGVVGPNTLAALKITLLVLCRTNDFDLIVGELNQRFPQN